MNCVEKLEQLYERVVEFVLDRIITKVEQKIGEWAVNNEVELLLDLPDELVE